MPVDRRINERQMAVLRWIADGADMDQLPAENYKISTYVLRDRNLIDLLRGAGIWKATITPAGEYYLEHGDFPPDHRYSRLKLTPVARPEPDTPAKTAEPAVRPSEITKPRRGRPPHRRIEPVFEFDIDSPRRLREQGRASDLPNIKHLLEDDPWDEKILVSPKEAAWMLSVDVTMIRQAVKNGDLHRVFIGEGQTHYRIVYQSLLAWVNDLPDSSPKYRW